MSAFKNYFIFISLSFCFLGCSSNSTRNLIWRDMALGAAVGGIYGQSKPDNQSVYTSMYAGIGAATVGIISSWVHTADDEQIKTENNQLKSQLQRFEQELKPKLTQQGSSLFNSPLPKEVSSLVEPGEWKRYKLDQWVQDPNQPNTWYRQVEMFEIIPPVAR